MNTAAASPAIPHKAYLLKRLCDPATAAAYINTAVREEDPAALLQALRNVAEAHKPPRKTKKRAVVAIAA